MSAPTTDAVTGRCETCGTRIVHLGGPSWRHVGRPGKGPHAADPDDATKARVRP